MLTTGFKTCFIRNALVFVFMAIAATSCTQHKRICTQKEGDRIMTDRLENAEHYFDKHPAFKEAFAFLRQPSLADLAPGRYEINEDKLFCMIQKGMGRSRAEAKLEAHRKYIDIQYVISGTEEMGWRQTSTCTQVDQEYDAAKDIGFFKDEPESWTKMTPGSFAIFFPKDAHAPMVSNGEIHKAVLKVILEH
jgi:biofilm protein TabA